MKKLVDLYRHNNQTLNDAFDRTIVGFHLKKQEFGYQTFLLTGCEPRVGTTTIAINLAIATAISGWKTILIDADMRKIAEFKRLNETAEKGLSDYLNNEAQLDEVIYQTNYESLQYISSGVTEKNPVRLLCSNKMTDFIEQLKTEYDYIFFDFPSINSAVDANILAKSVDAVTIIAAQGSTKIEHIKEAKSELEKSGANILGTIVNQVDKAEYKRCMTDYDYFRKKRYAGNRKYTHK